MFKYNNTIYNNISNIRYYTGISCKNSPNTQCKNNNSIKDKLALTFAEQNPIGKVTPAKIYENADIQKLNILEDNQGKSGIYRWTHKELGKFYIGSAENIKRRLKNYYSISCLEKEIKKNNSYIYRALLKYGYSAFSLDIIEYCHKICLIKKEQYYLDLIKPEYNILKYAYSMKGFKHTRNTKKLMQSNGLRRILSEETKEKITANSVTAQSVIVTNIKTGQAKEFVSIRRAAYYINESHLSYIAKSLNKKGIYKGKIILL